MDISRQLLNYEKRIYLNKDSANQLVLEKIRLYIDNKIFTQSLQKEFERVDHNKISVDEEKKRFFWNASLSSYLNNKGTIARQHFTYYSDLSKDSSIESHLLSVLIKAKTDTAGVMQEWLKISEVDTSLLRLKCIFTFSEEARSRTGLLIASALLPGSGTIILGYPVKGLVSLTLNSAAIFGIILLVKNNLYLNSLLFGLPWALKFYTGNILLTKQLALQKHQKQQSQQTDICKLALNEILKKYPLQYR